MRDARIAIGGYKLGMLWTWMIVLWDKDRDVRHVYGKFAICVRYWGIEECVYSVPVPIRITNLWDDMITCHDDIEYSNCANTNA